ncbi:carboxylesterase family protein [Kineococcus rhizosphaerae]|uniref:Carboxylesterase family protein n=1 Tax=Kineococcus rhizosphaerae TaxID=559628 RepID=A0A2T0R6M8_9ACTN|nr:carboxylesterase family protein [Kineococcus rhizosphaerae]PRY16780.1 carboxylesterase family protein [Kineococcus rhizosphaerae]
MSTSRRTVLGGTAAGVLALAACGPDEESAPAPASTSPAPAAGDLTLDAAAWRYDAEHDAYHQVGVTYVASPQAPDRERLAVVVPGAYFDAEDNGDGTFTVTASDGAVDGWTAATAPIVFPVNTPGYTGQPAVAEYRWEDVAATVSAGFVHVTAGLRGTDTNSDTFTGNAPWGVVDLKAAIRYVRANAEAIPGSRDRIVCYGHSGGGAQTAVTGTSGDAPEFTPYLEALGAAGTSDAIAAAVCWCPITSLGHANAAYEWNMGQFADTGTRAPGTWTEQYSKDLAAAYAGHLNSLDLLDEAGDALTLTSSATGIDLAGSYHDHVLAALTTSLNRFLGYTTFPHDGAATPVEFVAALDGGAGWVTFDQASGQATVRDLGGFVRSQKPPTKDVGAFDGVDRGATENAVFGHGTQNLHFARAAHDVVAAGEERYAQLQGWQAGYAASEYAADLEQTDSLGEDAAYRVDAYDPLHHLADGRTDRSLAPHWRIRTGLTQGDTASTVELNLAAALRGRGASVDFATVWGVGHTEAEETGDHTENFVAWVRQTFR